jgi:beta-lactamase superfamily II metal-dependent hydrolase
LAHLTILDVGHGNAAVVQGDRAVVVVDAPLGPTLLAHLSSEGIREVDALLISHADVDHVGGATSLLVNPQIETRTVYVNTEALRRGPRWRAFRSALAEGDAKRTIDVQAALTTQTHLADWGDFQVEVLSPPPVAALTGAGAASLAGHIATANEMAAVIRVSGAHSAVILASDTDAAALPALLDRNPRADVLVFPHHGGLPGAGDPLAYARALTAAVQPTLVVISLGRGQHNTPQPAVIQGIREGAPDARIACTQLSTRCAPVLTDEPSHLMPLAARGRESGSCCSGSLRIDLTGPAVEEGWKAAHREFVQVAAPQALCLQT